MLKQLKSRFIDYILPCVIIALALITSFVVIKNADYIDKNVIQNIEAGLFGMNNNKTGQYDKDLPGLYRRKNGSYYFITESLKLIDLPNSYHRVIKQAMVDHMIYYNSSYKDNAQKKLSDVAYNEAIVFYTGQYSLIIQSLRAFCIDSESREILSSIADYGQKISAEEQAIISYKYQLQAPALEYKIRQIKLEYQIQQWKQFWFDYNQSLGNPSKPRNAISYSEVLSRFADFNKSYYEYKEAISLYKKELTFQKSEIMARTDKLHLQEAILAELVEELKINKNIPQELKLTAVFLAEEIKNMTEKIDVKNTSKPEIIASIEMNSPDLKLKTKYFNDIEILIYPENAASLKCLAECLYTNNSESRCNNKCIFGLSGTNSN